MTISNCISLDELRRMAVGDIAALPAEQLVLLQDGLRRNQLYDASAK